MNVASKAGLKVRVFDPASGVESDIAGAMSQQSQEPHEVVTRGVDREAFEGWMAAYPDHSAAPHLREVSDAEADAIDAKLPPYHRSGGRIGI